MEFKISDAAAILRVSLKKYSNSTNTTTKTAKTLGAWLYACGVTIENIQAYSISIGAGKIKKMDMLAAIDRKNAHVLLPKNDDENSVRDNKILILGAAAMHLGASLENTGKLVELIEFNPVIEAPLIFKRSDAEKTLGLSPRQLRRGADSTIRSAKIIGAWLYAAGVRLEHLQTFAIYNDGCAIKKTGMLVAINKKDPHVLLLRKRNDDKYARNIEIRVLGAAAMSLGASLENTDKLVELINFKRGKLDALIDDEEIVKLANAIEKSTDTKKKTSYISAA